MNVIKKNKKIIIIILILVFIVPAVTFGRYIYNLFLDHYFASKNFYFNSDLLSKDGTQYTISNWSGVDSYILTINMNSIKNDKKYALSDIYYNIEYECGEKVNCYLNKDSGVIPASTDGDKNRDSFALTIIPKEPFVNNEETNISITAKSISPYKKTLSASFKLRASKIGLSYEITDKKNDIFSVLRLTNSLTYYTVKEAFGNYNVGDEIEQYKYQELSSEDKKKCYSLLVNLSFDPRVINMDLTNAYYLKVLKNNPSKINTIKLRKVLKSFGDYKEDDLIDENTYETLSEEEKDNISSQYDYVNGIIIEIDAISSADIKFYKKDTTNDYTYPFVNENSIVEIS